MGSKTEMDEEVLVARGKEFSDEAGGGKEVLVLFTAVAVGFIDADAAKLICC
jgi:hypothetical protein